MPPARRSARAGSSQSAGRDGSTSGSETAASDLAGAGLEHEGGGRRGRVARRGQLQFFGEPVLHADVERQAQGRGRHAPRPLHGLHPSRVVEQALDAGLPLVVGVDGADEVAGERAQRIGALELGAEGEAGEAQIVHALGHPRGEPARHPDEAPAAVGERLAQLGFVEAGKGGGELLDDLVEVEDQVRVGVERIDGDVGREQAAVAIDDVGPRPAARQRLGQRNLDLGPRPQRQPHQLPADYGEAQEHAAEGDERASAQACAAGAHVPRRSVPSCVYYGGSARGHLASPRFSLRSFVLLQRHLLLEGEAEHPDELEIHARWHHLLALLGGVVPRSGSPDTPISRRRYWSAAMGAMPIARASTSRRAGRARCARSAVSTVTSFSGPLERPLLRQHAHLEPARVVLDGIEGDGARQRGQHQHPVDRADRALHGGPLLETPHAPRRGMARSPASAVPRRGIGAHGPPELGRARPRVGGDLLVRRA